ncbi:MMPL family transporter, partial [Streptomyces sp. MBT57]|nr:MMPL family transporter [Streptomyces sp. MBT57]
MIRALTGFSTRHPWKVIALWSVTGILLAVAAGALMPRAMQAQTGDFLPKDYDSAAALRTADERFGVTSDAGRFT